MIGRHYSDITWASWCLKVNLSNILFRPTSKTTSKLGITLLDHCEGNRWLVVYHHKGPVMRKGFKYHNIILTVTYKKSKGKTTHPSNVNTSNNEFPKRKFGCRNTHFCDILQYNIIGWCHALDIFLKIGKVIILLTFFQLAATCGQALTKSTHILQDYYKFLHLDNDMIPVPVKQPSIIWVN